MRQKYYRITVRLLLYFGWIFKPMKNHPFFFLTSGHEYDSRFQINTMVDVWNRLDQLIAELQEKFGVNQVDILGHSLGTMVMHGYLASPERAAKAGRLGSTGRRPWCSFLPNE